jgi:hypothetical protein
MTQFFKIYTRSSTNYDKIKLINMEHTEYKQKGWLESRPNSDMQDRSS